MGDVAKERGLQQDEVMCVTFCVPNKMAASRKAITLKIMNSQFTKDDVSGSKFVEHSLSFMVYPCR
jgi:hypothetical protein